MKTGTALYLLILGSLAFLILASCGGGSQASPPPPTPPPPGSQGQGEWTWMSGSSVINQPGQYGIRGTPAPDNIPGAREGSVSWTDLTGIFWLFGGWGNNSAGKLSRLNDLWKYSGGQWTWMGGSNIGDQPGRYGTQGTPAPENIPGGRYSPLSWTDANGNLWLFGGDGLDSAGNLGPLNDLWKYSGGQWTWMGGSNVGDQPGRYGTKGTPAQENIPGARVYAASWADAAGNLWLFGGRGKDSAGTLADLNDLWKYSGGEWTWMSGSNIVNEPGRWGTLGTPAPDNVPGARYSPLSWTDASGNLWLFGGRGNDSTGTYGFLNDLWRYSGGEWTWMSGSNVINQPGKYGTKGTAAPDNTPGARLFSLGWTDTNGNLWLFGGFAVDSAGTQDNINDLWKYSGGQWTWMSGSNIVNQAPKYGIQGTPAPGNTPGARNSAVSWTDTNGNLWLFGGVGIDSTRTLGFFNDAWKYEP